MVVDRGRAVHDGVAEGVAAAVDAAVGQLGEGVDREALPELAPAAGKLPLVGDVPGELAEDRPVVEAGDVVGDEVDVPDLGIGARIDRDGVEVGLTGDVLRGPVVGLHILIEAADDVVDPVDALGDEAQLLHGSLEVVARVVDVHQPRNEPVERAVGLGDVG